MIRRVDKSRRSLLYRYSAHDILPFAKEQRAAASPHAMVGRRRYVRTSQPEDDPDMKGLVSAAYASEERERILSVPRNSFAQP